MLSRRRTVAALFAAGLALLGVSDLFDTAETATIPPGVTTPTHLKLQLENVELESSIDGAYKSALISSPATLDVVTNTGTANAKFGTGTANQQTWHGIRVTLASTGTFSGIDPCTGKSVADAAITLPNPSDQGVLLQYQVPHPVRGLPAGAISAQQFTVGSSPINVRVVAAVSNGVVCASESPPLSTITGSSTRLNVPFALYLDSANGEIAVADASGNRVTTFKLTDAGDVTPIRSIEGSTTGLQGPIGITFDSADNEIYVSNTGNNSLTVYNRLDTGDQAPQWTLTGDKTLINGPGGLYADPTQEVTQHKNGVLAVVNGGNNSITFYGRKASGNQSPFRVITGPHTGLSTPCGIAHDTDTHEMFVTNTGSNAITVYSDTDGGTTPYDAASDVAPKQVIAGVRTGLSKPCGIRIDGTTQEIAVANAGSNTITFYNISDSGDAYPRRTLSGNASGLSGPSDLAVDQLDDQLVVADSKNNSITFHKLNDATPFLAKPPILINGAWEQSLYASYTFSGTLDRTTGTPYKPLDAAGNYVAGARFDGYRIIWKITSDQLRQPADANSAILIPPTDEAFILTDGSVASNLPLGCNNFSPFSLLQLSTNCPPAPLIEAPFPPQAGSYHVAAALFGKTQNPALTLHVTRLSLDKVPRLEPTVALGTNDSILGVTWNYVDASDTPVPPPLPIITTQQLQINLTQPFSQVSSCYTQVAGNSPTLGYSSPSLGGDARSLSDIKNNRCDIFLNDVATMTFTVTDAYGEQYIFTWSPT